MKLAPRRPNCCAEGYAAQPTGFSAPTPSRTADDEPTHPVASPALKAGAGAVVLVLGWAPFAWASAPLLACLLAALAVRAAYGTWVWFTRGPGATR